MLVIWWSIVIVEDLHALPGSWPPRHALCFANGWQFDGLQAVWAGAIPAFPNTCLKQDTVSNAWFLLLLNMKRFGFLFFHRKADSVTAMTTPEQLHSSILKSLHYLNRLLPKGSHVILVGLADGTFLWDNMHDRYHPLDKYSSFLSWDLIHSCRRRKWVGGWCSRCADVTFGQHG